MEENWQNLNQNLSQGVNTTTGTVVETNKVTEAMGTRMVGKKALLAGATIVIFAGIITGGFLAGRRQELAITRDGGLKYVETKTEVGSQDTKTFKDMAEGTIEKGGVNGEGSHKLLRPGGPSQTVSLSSSVVDLDQFAGKKVQIWGETNTAMKSGWLMDVGRVKILN